MNKGPRTNNYLDVTCLRDILHVACLSLLNRPLSHEINKYSEIMTFPCMKSDHNVHSYRFQFV